MLCDFQGLLALFSERKNLVGNFIVEKHILKLPMKVVRRTTNLS